MAVAELRPKRPVAVDLQLGIVQGDGLITVPLSAQRFVIFVAKLISPRQCQSLIRVQAIPDTASRLTAPGWSPED